MTLYADHFAEVDAKHEKRLTKALKKIRDMDREDGHDLEGARLVSIRMQAIAKQSLEEK